MDHLQVAGSSDPKIWRMSVYVVQAKQKNMRVFGYMLLKIKVGRSDYFFIF